jgi:hypothetical protein
MSSLPHLTIYKDELFMEVSLVIPYLILTPFYGGGENFICGLGSVVGIATAYGLDSPGVESRWGRDIPHLSRLALRPTQTPVQWVPGLSRG